MANKHVPIPPLVLPFGMTVIAAVTMHDFWHYAEAGARAYQFGIFARDVANCGGLLLMVGMGPGPFAVDNAGKGGGKKRWFLPFQCGAISSIWAASAPGSSISSASSGRGP